MSASCQFVNPASRAFGFVSFYTNGNCGLEGLSHSLTFSGPFVVEWRRLEPAFLLPHRARPLQPFKNQLMKETWAHFNPARDPILHTKDASWQMRVLVHTHVNGEKTQCMSSEFPIGGGKIH